MLASLKRDYAKMPTRVLVRRSSGSARNPTLFVELWTFFTRPGEQPTPGIARDVVAPDLCRILIHKSEFDAWTQQSRVSEFAKENVNTGAEYPSVVVRIGAPQPNSSGRRQLGLSVRDIRV